MEGLRVHKLKEHQLTSPHRKKNDKTGYGGFNGTYTKKQQQLISSHRRQRQNLL